jgi:hypothetical protein
MSESEGPEKSLTFVGIDPATGEIRVSSAAERAWSVYQRGLSANQRQEVEAKCRTLGCSFDEMGAALVAVVADREGEFARLKAQGMPESDMAALLESLATERVKGRIELLDRTGTAPLLARLDSATGRLGSTDQVFRLAHPMIQGVPGEQRRKHEQRCADMGSSFEDWCVTQKAILLERSEEMRYLHAQMAPAAYSAVLERLTEERIKGRVEVQRALRAARN